MGTLLALLACSAPAHGQTVRIAPALVQHWHKLHEVLPTEWATCVRAFTRGDTLYVFDLSAALVESASRDSVVYRCAPGVAGTWHNHVPEAAIGPDGLPYDGCRMSETDASFQDSQSWYLIALVSCGGRGPKDARLAYRLHPRWREILRADTMRGAG